MHLDPADRRDPADDATPPGARAADAVPVGVVPVEPVLAGCRELFLALADDGATPPPPGVLSPVLARLRALLPADAAASVTVRRNAARRFQTSLATGPDAVTLDDLQYAAGTGPCLDATSAESAHPIVCPDLSRESRWSEFAARAVEASPFRSVISCPLPSSPDAGASLNIYGPPLDEAALALWLERALLLTALVAVAVRGLEGRQQAANLRIALTSSRAIGAAIGIVMAQRRATYDAAFDMLLAASQKTHSKLRDIADYVITTGELPTS